MRPRLLIVGFGPFPRVPRNPSGVLAKRIAALPRLRFVLGGSPRLLVMRTAYAALSAELEPALAERPDAVLMIGLATRAKRMRVEFRARNRASRLFPDAGGRAAPRLALDPDGPAERRSPAAARALVSLRRCGLDAAASQEAGRYLCNAAYYRALAEGRPTLFLHIPPFPRSDRPRKAGGRRPRPIEKPVKTWAEAFARVAIGLTASARLCPRS